MADINYSAIIILICGQVPLSLNVAHHSETLEQVDYDFVSALSTHLEAFMIELVVLVELLYI